MSASLKNKFLLSGPGEFQQCAGRLRTAKEVKGLARLKGRQ
jgi:hypothetical protein